MILQTPSVQDEIGITAVGEVQLDSESEKLILEV